MKLLIYGHAGWIGSQFLELLKNETELTYELGNSRCDDYDAICKEVEEKMPTHIISFIGRTHGKHNDKYYQTIDFLEQEGRLVDNVRDNLFSPTLLTLVCLKYDIHFTYLGTGCIFEYDENHTQTIGFTEDSLPNFFGSSYSIVKGFTDRLMKIIPGKILQLRIRMPIIGHSNARNFITKIIGYEKICSMPNSMSVLPDLLPIMLDMVKTYKTGTYNFTNPGVISHNEILDLYTKLCDNSFTYTNFTVEEQNSILASKRSNNFLETSKLELEYPFIPHIKESVENLLKTYN